MRRGGGGECNILLAVHRRDAGRRLQCGNYSAAAIAPGHSERQETIIMCLQAIRLYLEEAVLCGRLNGWRESKKRKWKWYNIFPELTVIVAIETYFPLAFVSTTLVLLPQRPPTPPTRLQHLFISLVRNIHLQNLCKSTWGISAQEIWLSSPSFSRVLLICS